MKKVITYGSFDLFHQGHYNLLKGARKLGDYLIVGVTTEQYDEYRGKLNVVDSLMDRIENIKKTGLADEIIIEDHEGQKLQDIQKYGIAVFVVGSDWKGKFDFFKDYCEVVYLERTKGISSTFMRQKNFHIVRFGVIGSGRIAQRFVSEAKFVSGNNVEGVFNPKLESASNFAQKFELKFASDDLSDFFSKIDAVYIASPHETHYNYIIEALRHGKHVLCEKPMALVKSQAEVAFALAKEMNLILFEAIKTAYTPGFVKLLSLVKGGRIGSLRDVEACFTKLVKGDFRELKNDGYNGSFAELGSYPVMAILKLYGTEFIDLRFESIVDENGVDLYTKAYFLFEKGLATAKVGLGIKSEGQLIASGTQGYLIAESPWWKTQSMEIRHENTQENEKFFVKYYGDGLRYEISDFISMLNGNGKKAFKLTAEESIALANVMERFRTGVGVNRIQN